MELVEHLPNILSGVEFDTLKELLKGTTKTARQIYRSLAETEVRRVIFAEKKYYPNHTQKFADVTRTDRDLEKFLSEKRKEGLDVIAYNTVQKALRELENKNIAEIIKKNGSKHYGVSLFFFSMWKQTREKINKKVVEKAKEEGIDRSAAVKRLGLRTIDLEFFNLA